MACKYCGSVETKEILTPELMHYAKLVCADCDRWIKWIPNPDRKSVLHNFFQPVGDPDNPDDYICVFGKKHMDHRLSEIALHDPQWLEWIAENDFPQEVIDLVEEAAL